MKPPYTTTTGKMAIYTDLPIDRPDQLLERNRVVAERLFAGCLAWDGGKVRLGLALKKERWAAAEPVGLLGDPVGVSFLASVYRIDGGVPGIALWSGNKMWIAVGAQRDLAEHLCQEFGWLPHTVEIAPMCVRFWFEDGLRALRKEQVKKC